MVKKNVKNLLINDQAFVLTVSWRDFGLVMIILWKKKGSVSLEGFGLKL